MSGVPERSVTDARTAGAFACEHFARRVRRRKRLRYVTPTREPVNLNLYSAGV